MKRLLLCLCACLVGGASVGFAADALPVMNVGDTYDADETYRITSPELGANGFVEVTVQSTYEVMGVESVTQDATGNSYMAYRLDATGTASGTGEVDVAAGPINIQGPVRLTGGSMSGTFWLGDSDFASIKKERELTGTIEYQLVPGQFLPLGDLTITEGEEYDPPLADHQFPLDFGDTWSQSVNVIASGELVIPVLGPSVFDETIPLNLTANVDPSPVDIMGCQTKQIVHTDPMSPITVENYYCCEANWSLDQVITNLPLGDTGTIERFQLMVVNYNVADDSCGGTTIPTPTPTPTMGMPTPTPMPGDSGLTLSANGSTFNAGDQVIWSMRVQNNTGGQINALVYVGVDIGGTFLFYPALTEDAAPLFSDVPLPSPFDFEFPFFELPSPDTGGSPLMLTWLGGLFETTTGDLYGDISSVTTTHQ